MRDRGVKFVISTANPSLDFGKFYGFIHPFLPKKTVRRCKAVHAGSAGRTVRWRSRWRAAGALRQAARLRWRGPRRDAAALLRKLAALARACISQTAARVKIAPRVGACRSPPPDAADGKSRVGALELPPAAGGEPDISHLRAAAFDGIPPRWAAARAGFFVWLRIILNFARYRASNEIDGADPRRAVAHAKPVQAPPFGL